MYQTARHTALLVALMLKRSEKSRIRFSENTMRRLGERTKLRSAFVSEVQLAAMDLGVVLVELQRGGFGATWSSGLEGAPAVTAKALIPAKQRAKLKEEDILHELELPELAGDEE